MTKLERRARRAGEMLCALALIGGGGCGKVASSEPDAVVMGPADARPVDAPADAAPRCDPTAPFGAPVPVPGFETQVGVGEPRLTPDELEIYVGALVAGAATDDLYVARRTSRSEPFGKPAKIAAASAPDHNENGGFVTTDDRTLMFHSNYTTPGNRIYVATRSSPLVDFGTAAPLAGVAAPAANDNDISPFESADGAELWFGSDRAGGLGGTDLWVAARVGSGFADPVHVASVSSDANEEDPVLSSDGLTLYVASRRAGGTGGFDIWRARRTTTHDPFSTPVEVKELDSDTDDIPGWISPDDCRFYLQSDRGGQGSAIYVATRAP
jgi:hypothetical protein